MASACPSVLACLVQFQAATMTSPLAFLLAACIGTSSPDCPADRATAQESRPPDLEPHANFIVPALEIVAMDGLLNAIGRQITDDNSFDVTRGSIRRNLRRRWVVDDDPFEINQVLHPYQGAMYHNFARSSGLNYWQSLAYTLAGSLMWVRVICTISLLEAEDPILAWQDRMLDLFGGLCRKAKAAV